jgi:predicted ester cyclase
MKKSMVMYPILLILVAGCQNKETRAALDEVQARSEVEEQNKALVEKYLQTWNSQNFQIMDECLDDAFTIYVPSNTGQPMLLERSKEWIDGIFAAWPDIHYEIQDMLVDNDRVCVRWTCTATYYPDPDDPATAKEITGSAIELFRVVNGKITEERTETDSQGWQQQMGQ